MSPHQANNNNKTHNRAVIIASPGQLHKVVAGFGGVRGVQLDCEGAQRGSDLDAGHRVGARREGRALGESVEKGETIGRRSILSSTKVAKKEKKENARARVCCLASTSQFN
jgi:hypothetical protein